MRHDVQRIRHPVDQRQLLASAHLAVLEAHATVVLISFGRSYQLVQWQKMTGFLPIPAFYFILFFCAIEAFLQIPSKFANTILLLPKGWNKTHGKFWTNIWKTIEKWSFCGAFNIVLDRMHWEIWVLIAKPDKTRCSSIWGYIFLLFNLNLKHCLCRWCFCKEMQSEAKENECGSSPSVFMSHCEFQRLGSLTL